MSKEKWYTLPLIMNRVGLDRKNRVEYLKCNRIMNRLDAERMVESIRIEDVNRAMRGWRKL